MHVNPAKTRTTLDGEGQPQNLYVAGDGTRFVPWCGLLLNASNLEVQADYTRYLGQHIRDSLTLPLAQVRHFPPGSFQEKML